MTGFLLSSSSAFRVQGSEFRVQGSEFRVSSLWFLVKMISSENEKTKPTRKLETRNQKLETRKTLNPEPAYRLRFSKTLAV